MGTKYNEKLRFVLFFQYVKWFLTEFFWEVRFKSPQKSVTAVERIYMYLQKKGIKKIAVLNATDKFGQEGEEALKALSGKYGVTIVAQEKFEVSDVDMTVQLTKIKAADPQAVICWTIGPPAG